MNKLVSKKAKAIIKNQREHTKLVENCIKAGICMTCGNPLSAEFIPKYELCYTTVSYKRVNLFKRVKTVTSHFNAAVRIFCKDNHQEYYQQTQFSDQYSDTLNNEILDLLSKLR